MHTTIDGDPDSLLRAALDEFSGNCGETAKQALAGVSCSEVHFSGWRTGRIQVIWTDVTGTQRPDTRNDNWLTTRILQQAFELTRGNIISGDNTS
jgi:hypothetical protein